MEGSKTFYSSKQP